ncbi:MAG: (d)CMP kinase [Microbacteriaceae bacterium]|nr:(d)CMP kinase [Microbacteriaceae bacterium]
MSPIVVGIDGPAGSGKSSVSRAAAAALGFRYLDTGAAYRAIAWNGLETGADLTDPAVVLHLVETTDLETALDPAERWVRVGPRDVTTAIREPRVSAATTWVARNQAARDRLNAWFRELIASAEPGIVVEGRDVTTVVVPDAPVRILLTAEPEMRALRRARELEEAGNAQDAADVLAAIAERDARDSAMVEFLNAAPGVDTIDSTSLSFDETVDAVVARARQA